MRKSMIVLSWLVLCSSTVLAADFKSEVSISKDMYETVTCKLNNDQLVWYESNATKDAVVIGEKETITTFISFTTQEGRYDVVLAKYTAKDPDAALKEISFFYVDFWEKGVVYKKLHLPQECIFWLRKGDGHYIITNIKRYN